MNTFHEHTREFVEAQCLFCIKEKTWENAENYLMTRRDPNNPGQLIEYLVWNWNTIYSVREPIRRANVTSHMNDQHEAGMQELEALILENADVASRD